MCDGGVSKGISKTASTTANAKEEERKEEEEKKSRCLTREEVGKLADPDKLLLIIIHDKIYDCTNWQHSHPGGHLTIRALCGKDATDPFIATHLAHVVTQKYLNPFLYGTVQDVGELDSTTAAFRSLTEELIQSGWYKTNYTFYYKLAAIYSTLFACIVAGVTMSGDRLWVHALSGALLGLFWQQVAFIGHDIGHNSVTHDRELDSYIGLFVGNFLTGISIGWWKRSHNIHHIVTNSCEHDPDIQHLPFFAVNSLFLKQPIFSTFFEHFLPLTTMAHILVKYQHWLYYPVMAVARFNLYVQSLTHAMGIGVYKASEKLWRRNLQIYSLAGFWVWLITLTLQLPSSKSRLVFILVSHAVAGILHVQITLSHFSMPSYSGITYDANNGYITTQLNYSMNVDCSPWMDWFHGGLQFQVEHHLWPRVPRHNLRKLRTILENFCKEHKLQYHSDNFCRANWRTIMKLKEVSNSTKTFSELFFDSINLKG